MNQYQQQLVQQYPPQYQQQSYQQHSSSSFVGTTGVFHPQVQQQQQQLKQQSLATPSPSTTQQERVPKKQSKKKRRKSKQQEPKASPPSPPLRVTQTAIPQLHSTINNNNNKKKTTRSPHQQQQHPLQHGDAHPHDVLLGRGKAAASWPGNQRYQRFIKDAVPAYEGAMKNAAKLALTRHIVAMVTAEGGRFLKYTSDETWVPIPIATARVKVAQALRHWRRRNGGAAGNGKPAQEEDQHSSIEPKESQDVPHEEGQQGNKTEEPPASCSEDEEAQVEPQKTQNETTAEIQKSPSPSPPPVAKKNELSVSPSIVSLGSTNSTKIITDASVVSWSTQSNYVAPGAEHPLPLPAVMAHPPVAALAPAPSRSNTGEMTTPALVTMQTNTTTMCVTPPPLPAVLVDQPQNEPQYQQQQRQHEPQQQQAHDKRDQQKSSQPQMMNEFEDDDDGLNVLVNALENEVQDESLNGVAPLLFTADHHPPTTATATMLEVVDDDGLGFLDPSFSPLDAPDIPMDEIRSVVPLDPYSGDPEAATSSTAAPLIKKDAKKNPRKKPVKKKKNAAKALKPGSSSPSPVKKEVYRGMPPTASFPQQQQQIPMKGFGGNGCGNETTQSLYQHMMHAAFHAANMAVQSAMQQQHQNAQSPSFSSS